MGRSSSVSRLSRVSRILGVAAATAAAVALYVALFATPAEAAMGEYIRILYVHVGAAWTTYLSFGVTALAAVAFLWRRTVGWDQLAAASAEVGLVLASLTLMSGMIWGRAAQGWWWRWDDLRLTLTLLLWFIYAAYLILRQYTTGERRATLSAVLAVAAVPTMVLNHFAVVLFQAYHPQPIVARPEGPAMAAEFLVALLQSVVAYTLLYAWLVTERMQLSLDRGKLALMAAARRG